MQLPAAFEHYASVFDGGEPTAWCGTCYVRLLQLDTYGLWSAKSIAQGLGFPAGYVRGLPQGRVQPALSAHCFVCNYRLYRVRACMHPPVPCCSVQRLL